MKSMAWLLLSLPLAAVAACGADEAPDASSGSSSSSSGAATTSSSGGGVSSSGASSGGSGGSSGGGSSSSGGSSGGGAWPDETNTGIPDGACPDGLRAFDPATEERPPSGTTFECVRFVGGWPYIGSGTHDITFRYCRFESDSADAFLNLQDGPVTIEDSEFVGAVGTWIRATYDADDVSVRRCDFSGMANAFEWATHRVHVEDNYVHDFGNVEEDQHADGFQGNGPEEFFIHHNTVFLNSVWGGTNTISFDGAGEVSDNLIAGGGYTLHTFGHVQITGNRFSTRFSDTCGEYGPVYPMAIGEDSTWSDNRWEDGPNAGQEIARPE